MNKLMKNLIKMRLYAGGLLIVGFLGSSVNCWAEEKAKANPDKPNIVLILSDDQSWNHYSMFDHEYIKTPHIDKLATSGVLFRRSYVSIALCRPSLMSLVTGHYAHTTGITGNDPNNKGGRKDLNSFIQKFETFPTLLKEQGYLSFQSGKWWEGSYSNGGFTHGMTQGGRHGDAGLGIGRKGLKPCTDFIDLALEANKPFFLWYAPIMPHLPHTPPPRLAKKYAQLDIPESYKKYYATIEWFDETCGDLIGYLEKKGIRDNTLIVYISDNGWSPEASKKNRPQRFTERSKHSVFEGGVRQPMIMSWPANIRPSEHEGLVSSIDIFPTIVAAAGARQPTRALPGMNLLPVMAGKKDISDRAVFGERFACNIPDIHNPEASLVRRWVIQGRYKLIISYDGKDDPTSINKVNAQSGPMLYDLIKDPHEEENLYPTLPKVYKSLRAMIDNWYPLKERKAYE
jgi:uncharacterized sulfatase